MKSEWSVSPFALPPFGEGMVVCRDRDVVLVLLPREGGFAALRARALRGGASPVLEECQPGRGFAGEAAAILTQAARRGETVGSLPWRLTTAAGFTRSVLDRCLRIPRGDVRTYGDLAREAGNPRAARAVGQAMATNPLPLLIPCHRVVPSGGGVGNFGGGGALKRWLLEREGALEADLLPA